MYGVLIAVPAILMAGLWIMCRQPIDRFFGWSLYDRTKWASAQQGIGLLAYIAVPAAAEVMVFAPGRRTAAGWLVAGPFVYFLVGPVARFDKDHPAWLPAYDVLTRLSLIGVVGWAA